MRNQLLCLTWCQELLKNEVVLQPDDYVEPKFNVVMMLLVYLFINTGLYVLLFHAMYIFRYLWIGLLNV
jgi:hypothetical protein